MGFTNWTESEMIDFAESTIGSSQPIETLLRHWLEIQHESEPLVGPIDLELQIIIEESPHFWEIFDDIAFICNGCGWIYEIGDESSPFASKRLCSDCAEDYEELE